MNFQKLKVSACGHELGSSILFGARIGFSGTPSNLLPIDLGDCQYEPGSDGRIVHEPQVEAHRREAALLLSAALGMLNETALDLEVMEESLKAEPFQTPDGGKYTGVTTCMYRKWQDIHAYVSVLSSLSASPHASHPTSNGVFPSLDSSLACNCCRRRLHARSVLKTK